MGSTNAKKAVGNVMRVLVSNILSIVVGIAVGFILPKLLDIEDYGYYKTYNLYASYIGLFTLGIIDGIVLEYGAKDYEELDKKYFRSIGRLFALIQLGFLIGGVVIAIVFLKGEYRFIFCATGVYILAQNITNYFQQISQITQRFKEYSYRNVIKSILTLVAVGLLYIFYIINIDINYRIYVLMVLIISYLLTLWYLYTYRDLIIGEHKVIRTHFADIRYLIKLGFPLLFANLCSTFILIIDRQFVNVLFNTETYAVYAFAYNMLSLVTVATSAMAVVLYPILKRTDEQSLKNNYMFLISSIQIFVFGALCAYFPLCVFIDWFLPKYASSLVIFRIIFPGLAMNAAITVVMHNFYKTIGANLLFFKKSIITLLISIVANAIAYILFGTTQAISIASMITMLIWYLYVEYFLSKKYEINTVKGLFYLVMMTVLFYCITSIQNSWVGFMLYVIVYLAVAILFFKDTIVRLVYLVHHKINN